MEFWVEKFLEKHNWLNLLDFVSLLGEKQFGSPHFRNLDYDHGNPSFSKIVSFQLAQFFS